MGNLTKNAKIVIKDKNLLLMILKKNPYLAIMAQSVIAKIANKRGKDANKV